MASYNTTVNLDLDSLVKLGEKFSNDMGSFEKFIMKSLDDGLEDLMKQSEQKLREKIIQHNVILTGELLSSVRSEALDKGFVVGVGTDYAIYVEFGTGLVGQANSHPMQGDFGVEYRDSGWWYPTTPDNPYAVETESGDFIVWTEGQSSKPYMMDTFLWIVDNHERILSKYIGEGFLNWIDSLGVGV